MSAGFSTPDPDRETGSEAAALEANEQSVGTVFAAGLHSRFTPVDTSNFETPDCRERFLSPSHRIGTRPSAKASLPADRMKEAKRRVPGIVVEDPAYLAKPIQTHPRNTIP